MPNSDHPLLDQIAKLRDELKSLDKQKRKAAKLHVLEKEEFEERIAELVPHSIFSNFEISVDQNMMINMNNSCRSGSSRRLG